MSINIKPFVVVNLSGWGIASASSGNAISLARTPNFDRLVTNYKSFVLESAGNSVGLLADKPGNARVGYLNMGAGKIVYELLPKINVAIRDRSFFENIALDSAIENCLANDSSLHLLGQISKVQKHSSMNHLFALLDLARSKGVKQAFLHLILDGVDTDNKDGLNQIKKIQEQLDKINFGKIATVHGLYYGMNRDGFWDKTEKSYRAIVEGLAEKSGKTAQEIIEKSYQEDLFDDELTPGVISANKKAIGKVSKNDSLIVFNFKSDRIRQIAKAFVDPDFDKFQIDKKLNLKFVGMINYLTEFEFDFAFKQDKVEKTLALSLDEKYIKQTYVAESDKSDQLLNFFRNGLESNNIEDVVVSENKIAKTVVERIVDEKVEFLMANFSMADKEADSADIKKTIRAIEKIDAYLGKISDAVLGKGGVLLITSDHGNVEEFSSLQSGNVEKENSNNPVPFILTGEKWGEDKELSGGKVDLSLTKNSGNLADIAPTILKILDIKKPKEMTGKSLI